MEKIEKFRNNVIYILKRIVMLNFIFAFSGVVYGMIEILFRGRTDISMVIVGGICGLIITILNDLFSYEMDYIFQGCVCTICITIIEFLAGILVNANYNIWDYRHLSGTFGYGQCNVYFVIAWFFLAMLFIPIMDLIEWKIFNYKKDIPPYYKVFGKKLFSLNKIKLGIRKENKMKWKK